MKLGILGGSFDPIHLGHLIMAEQARDQLALDRVWLVPASRPPHKPERAMTPYEHRIEMARLAVGSHPGIEVSDMERDPTRPSFTADTLRDVRAQIARDDELWLILGADSLRDFETWREPDAIASLARVAVQPRPGTDLDRDDPLPESLRAAGLDVTWLGGARIELSASLVREHVRRGRSIRFLVPERVRAFIAAHHLYQDGVAAGETREADDG